MAPPHPPTISTAWLSFLIPQVPTVATGRTYLYFLRLSNLDSMLLVASFYLHLLPLVQDLVMLVLRFRLWLVSFRVIHSWYSGYSLYSWYQVIGMLASQETD